MASATTSPPERSPLPEKRAAVVGTGLIGASIGMALRARGWHVTGTDRQDRRAHHAVAAGALDALGVDPQAEVTFVATPVSAVASEARSALVHGGVVTDVGSVKEPIVTEVDHPRFVGGHPMAGSEQEGVDGADPRLFEGATWVLTPRGDTEPGAYARVRTVVSSLGADVVAVPPERHDSLVALVSHVPHLAAATLMCLAAEGAEEHAALLRLAARTSLPGKVARPERLVEIRVPVPDRPGVLAEVTTLAGELSVNIEDLEIVHSAEGERGVLVLLVDARHADLLRGALFARGFRPSAHPLA